MSVKARNISYLLQKYSTKQPGERWTKEHETMNRKEYRLNKKIMKARTFGSQMYMTKNQIERVIDIIKEIDDLQKLHRKLSDHDLIYIICYFIKQQDHHDFKFKSNSFCKTFNHINETSFRKVLCNIPKYYYTY